MTLQETYDLIVSTPSDINEHLPTLREYAKGCKRITEMGFRSGNSTYAFIMAHPEKLISYDLDYHENVEIVKKHCVDSEIEYKFIQGNVLDLEIEETDFLFIDTLHNAFQLQKELELHATKALKFIAFHDTFTFYERGETTELGLRYALEPFLESHPEWIKVYHTDSNNGLTIIQHI